MSRFWKTFSRVRDISGGILHVLLHQFVWEDKKRTGR